VTSDALHGSMGASHLRLGDKGRIAFMGAQMDRLTMDDLNGIISDAIRSGAKRIVANHNLHSLYLLQRHPRLRQFFDRPMFVHIDGMPLVLLARLLGYPVDRRHRTTYVDWFPRILSAAAAAGWRIYYLGSTDDVVSQGLSTLQENYPGLQVQGRHGFFDVTPAGMENQQVVADIAAFRPHILMVGMSMPRQELWIDNNFDAVPANIFLPCGACLDYVVGAVATPPRWAGRVGLEWLFRLMADPRRLGSRYLLEPWSLLPQFLAELVRRRLFRWDRRGGAARSF
jgi:N-acetylglucosaminyldiphosphoundecaprenol N-acetyl-beta-D-mannosaminyltransferase